MAIVIDASVVLALLLNEELASKAEAIMAQGGLCAPALLNLEVTNGLVSAIRRKRMTKQDATSIIETFATLPIAFDEQATSSPKLLACALNHDLTTYDASYLLLAQRLRAPLASFDERLCDAAKSIEIVVLS
jgi:predicted nucleic acid-binding protein